jgi:hypothetical protein
MTQPYVIEYGFEKTGRSKGEHSRSKGERTIEIEKRGGPMMVDQQLKPQGPIKAIVLDVFGTLCEIWDKRGPFAKLARLSSDRAQARELLMTLPLTLRRAASELHLESVDRDELEADLQAELESIELSPRWRPHSKPSGRAA